MPKKKKQTEGPEEAPVNQTFSEPAADQAAATDQTRVVNQAISQDAAPAAGQTAAPSQAATQPQSQTQSQIPPDLAELIKSTLAVIIAQRRTHALAATLTSLTNAVVEALKRYLRFVPKSVVREYVRSQLVAMGYTVVPAVVDHGGALYQAEVVVLFKNYEEFVDMVKNARMSSMIKPLIKDVDPLFDKKLKEAYV